MKPLLMLCLGWIFSSATLASTVGQPLPPLEVPKKGELVIDGDSVTYRPWSTNALPQGMPVVLLHLAATMGADAMIKPLTERLEAEQFDEQKHRVITIVNLNDAMWGTGGLVSSEMKKNKQKHPEAVLVADDKGRGISAWSVPRKSTTVMLVAPGGTVLFRHDGKLDTATIDRFVGLLREEIGKSG